MIYGYIRVSSDKQTVENQRFEINNFCKARDMEIDGWIEETISGTKAYDKRALGYLLNRIEKGDLIICAELSRLGRNLFMIMEILNICMSKECRVWTIKDNYRLGDDIQSKVLAFAFGLSAEIERNLISQRTKEALARKKAEGVILGRPKGRKTDPKKHKLFKKKDMIIDLHNRGYSLRNIAVIVNVDRGTLQKYARNVLELKTSPTDRFEEGLRLAEEQSRLITRLFYEGATYSEIAKDIGSQKSIVSAFIKKHSLKREPIQRIRAIAKVEALIPEALEFVKQGTTVATFCKKFNIKSPRVLEYFVKKYNVQFSNPEAYLAFCKRKYKRKNKNKSPIQEIMG